MNEEQELKFKAVLGLVSEGHRVDDAISSVHEAYNFATDLDTPCQAAPTPEPEREPRAGEVTYVLRLNRRDAMILHSIIGVSCGGTVESVWNQLDGMLGDEVEISPDYPELKYVVNPIYSNLDDWRPLGSSTLNWRVED